MRSPLLLALSLLLVPFALVPAASTDGAAISPEHPTLTWHGRSFDAGATPHGALCADVAAEVGLCDVFAFRVHAPAGVALEVAIRWGSEQNDLDLFLYDASGALVAESTGMISVAEGLLLPDVRPGEYRAVVVPATVGAATAYEGLAQLEPPVERHGDLLPDLATLPPSGLRIVAPVYFTATPLDVGGVRPLSCAPDETLEAGATRCLRFNNAIANRGAGPLEARFPSEGVPAGLVDGDTRVIYQRIYRADGSFHERDAGRYTFHAVHAHFHYEDFAEHALYAVTDDGLVQVRDGRKAGFCMVDVALDAWAEPANGARTYKAPVCLAPTDGTELVQGITAGWADVYTWDLPDQYVDITGLPDGCYRLETRADPLRYFVETDTSNNAAHVDLTLRGDEVHEGC